MPEGAIIGNDNDGGGRGGRADSNASDVDLEDIDLSVSHGGSDRRGVPVGKEGAVGELE